MPTKTATKRAGYQIAEFKAVGTLGEFTAIVSVFGNVDFAGDRVMPGAFKASLQRWKSSGDPVPILWSHAWDDPFAHIGFVTDAIETNVGLQITGKLDVDKPFAKQVFDLLVARRVKEFSFAYDIVREQRASDSANELLELDLIEVGPTLKGCNPETELLATKALQDAKEHTMGAPTISLSGRKIWVNEGIDGTYEDTQEDIQEAATALFNPTADDGVWVSVQGTFPDHVIIEVCTRGGAEDEYYDVPWAYDTDCETVILGTPAAVDVSVTVTPATDEKSAKAGRTISNATAAELKSITDDLAAAHDMYGKAMDRMGALCSSATADEPKAAPIEDSKTLDDDREPQAKSTDMDWLALRTRIEEARATK